MSSPLGSTYDRGWILLTAAQSLLFYSWDRDTQIIPIPNVCYFKSFAKKKKSVGFFFLLCVVFFKDNCTLAMCRHCALCTSVDNVTFFTTTFKATVHCQLLYIISKLMPSSASAWNFNISVTWPIQFQSKQSQCFYISLFWYCTHI